MSLISSRTVALNTVHELLDASHSGHISRDMFADRDCHHPAVVGSEPSAIDTSCLCLCLPEHSLAPDSAEDSKLLHRPDAHRPRGGAGACRDPQADSWQHVEAALLRALDAENVAAIAAQIRATLRTLLQASAGGQPSRWLTACSAIVLSSGPASQSAAGGACTLQDSGMLHCRRLDCA